MRRTEIVKRNSSFKGYTAAASVIATSALLFYGWWLMAVFGAGASGYFIYKWLHFRGKNGLYFK